MDNTPTEIIQSKEIAEYIYKDEHNNINLELIYNLDRLNVINNLLIKNHNIGDKLLCLDLHGVADLYKDDIIISKLPIFIISFVGRYTETRKNAREQIINKILKNQIIAGILVFKKNSKVSNGKAVIIRNLLDNNKHIYFIDDGYENIAGVDKLKNLYDKDKINLDTYYINNNIKSDESDSYDSLDEIKKIITTIDAQEGVSGASGASGASGGSMVYYKLKYFK